MALTAIRNLQIKDQTITRTKLVLDFLNGSNWDITNGANNFTITGLADGVNPRDAVTKAQLDAIASGVAGGVQLRDGLAGAADLTTNTTGNTYADGSNGYLQGDKFYITSDGNLTVSDGTIAVNNGDCIIINKDVATDGAIVVADILKIDNTESADILRTADVVNDLTTGGIGVPLSAQQGVVIDGRLTTVENRGIPVYGEIPTVTAGLATVGALVNTPILGTDQVYLNGLRMEKGAGCDYTISGGNITFEYPLEANDKVLVDYRR